MIFVNIVVLGCLGVIAWVDQRTMEIPDVLNCIIAACGVVVIVLGGEGELKGHLIGMAVCSVPLLLIALLIEGAFGLGDVKLMGAAGLFLGLRAGTTALLFGLVAGGLQAGVLLLTKRKGLRDSFPFGPALCSGVVVAIIIKDSLLL